MLERSLRREHVTLDEVESQLRKKGVERLDQVKRMYLENEGGFSVICVPARSLGADASMRRFAEVRSPPRLLP